MKIKVICFKKINIERTIFLLFFISFAALLLVQAVMLHPSVRASLIVQEVLEGTPLGSEEALYNEGTVVLKLKGSSPNKDIKVLINGKEAAEFTESKLQLQIIDGDVIEIDGSAFRREIDVTIHSCSDNISPEYLGKTVTVFSNIKKLARVRIRQP